MSLLTEKSKIARGTLRWLLRSDDPAAAAGPRLLSGEFLAAVASRLPKSMSLLLRDVALLTRQVGMLVGLHELASPEPFSSLMRRSIFPAIVIILASCTPSSSSLVTVKAELVRYNTNSMHFEYANGAGEWFDGAVVRIVSPPGLTGRELTVYFNKEMKRPLGPVGVKLGFSVERRYFDDTPGHLFYGDLKDLKRRE